MSSYAWLKERPIAHRGFHDMNKSVWENTLSAFSRAVEAGFAIECDLQYAADGVPVVFHDDDLQRLCNMPGDVRAKSSAELALMTIGGTKDRVPRLKDMLNLVKGKVPLVIELKGRRGDDEGFVESVLEALEGYEGKVALMSFDVWLLKELKEAGAPYPVGLTAHGDKSEDWDRQTGEMKIGLDFTSYHYAHLPNPFTDGVRAKGLPVITWTVRDKEAVERTFAHADQMTFEGFDPRTELTAG
jgi:glycerophosphoryl diester phosphodiesterase